MVEVVRPKIVATGIDSLNIGFNIGKMMLDDAALKHLADRKAAAGDKLFGGKGITVELAGKEFNMLPRGSKGYEYVMYNDDLRLCLAQSCQGGLILPEVFVQLNSSYLWGKGYHRAYSESRQWIGEFAKIDSERVNRVDLCVDLEIKLPIIDVKREIVTRSRKKVDYFQAEHYTDGLRGTGYSFGAGRMMARIYDKGCEIKHSEKLWFPDVWKSGGHDGISPVTRVEGQF